MRGLEHLGLAELERRFAAAFEDSAPNFRAGEEDEDVDRRQLESLIYYIDRRMREGFVCMSTHELTEKWARAQRKRPPHVVAFVRAYGGCCDCKVVPNVDPECVFGEARLPPAPPTAEAAGQLVMFDNEGDKK